MLNVTQKNKTKTVMESCVELTEKKKRFYYITDKCGCKSKYGIQYELNGKIVKKTLCGRHFKSVTSWLEKINVKYYYYQLK